MPVGLTLCRVYYDRESKNRKASAIKPKFKVMLQDNYLEFGFYSKVMLPFTNIGARRYNEIIEGKHYYDIQPGYEALEREGSKILFSDICLDLDIDIMNKHRRGKFYKVAELLKAEMTRITEALKRYYQNLPENKYIFDRVRLEEVDLLGQVDMDAIIEKCVEEVSEKINQGNV